MLVGSQLGIRREAALSQPGTVHETVLGHLLSVALPNQPPPPFPYAMQSIANNWREKNWNIAVRRGFVNKPHFSEFRSFSHLRLESISGLRFTRSLLSAMLPVTFSQTKKVWMETLVAQNSHVSNLVFPVCFPWRHPRKLGLER